MRGFRPPGAWIDEVHPLDASRIECTPLSTLTVEGGELVYPLWMRETLEHFFPGKVRAHRAPTLADLERLERILQEARS